MAAMKEFDNNNPALWRIGDRSLEHGIYLAVTDGKVATRCSVLSNTHASMMIFLAKVRRSIKLESQGRVGVC